MPPTPRRSRDEAEDSLLHRIAGIVRAGRGLDLDQYKRGFLRRRLGVRQRALGVDDLPAYADRLARDPEEIDRLLRALTINVSEFLRNPSLFRLLKTTVLPDLLASCRSRGRSLQIWSAGCASGEEIYSVGILLDQLGVDPGKVRLLGTDIDREAIAAAREGTYDGLRLREIPPALRERYFESGPRPRTFRIRSDRLPPTRFRIHDLLAAPLRRGLDLVLCRNVLIYFELKLQDEILERIGEAVRPDGVLVLGRVERLSGRLRDSFQPLDLRERVYRKIPPGASHAR